MKSGKLKTDFEVLEIQNLIFNSIENTAEERDFFKKWIKVKRVKKGEFLLKEGQTIRSSYYLFKGCIREYYLKEGEEKTVEFYTADLAPISWKLEGLQFLLAKPISQLLNSFL